MPRDLTTEHEKGKDPLGIDGFEIDEQPEMESDLTSTDDTQETIPGDARTPCQCSDMYIS